MATFELNNKETKIPPSVGKSAVDPALSCGKIKEECIIALKVYDQCRQQDCLTEGQIGPARAAEQTVICDKRYEEGDIIDPPQTAAAVSMDLLRIRKIIIVDKNPNPFKNGYWDINLKYVFEYRLTFREADGSVLGYVRANSIYNKMLTLFGSIGTDIVIATDLFNNSVHDSATLDADPFILAEAKGVPLAAELGRSRHINCSPEELSSYAPNQVDVSIGLLTIIKLVRIVHLSVESRGFCVPPECDEISPLNPCEFFNSLEFPLNIFSPPQKPEFFGVADELPPSAV
jgi:hypothetical protein